MVALAVETMVNKGERRNLCFSYAVYVKLTLWIFFFSFSLLLAVPMLAVYIVRKNKHENLRVRLSLNVVLVLLFAQHPSHITNVPDFHIRTTSISHVVEGEP